MRTPFQGTLRLTPSKRTTAPHLGVFRNLRMGGESGLEWVESGLKSSLIGAESGPSAP